MAYKQPYAQKPLPPAAKPSTIGEFLNPFDAQSRLKRSCRGNSCKGREAFKSNRGDKSFGMFNSKYSSSNYKKIRRGRGGSSFYMEHDGEKTFDYSQKSKDNKKRFQKLKKFTVDVVDSDKKYLDKMNVNKDYATTKRKLFKSTLISNPEVGSEKITKYKFKVPKKEFKSNPDYKKLKGIGVDQKVVSLGLNVLNPSYKQKK